MCGIWALFGLDTNVAVHGNASFNKIAHRGPDAWRVEADSRLAHASLGFQRLKVVDSVHGMQPMKLHCLPNLTLMCNGEIYNCKRLKEEYGFKCETGCDVEPILHLYAHGGIELATSQLDAEFAFCLLDIEARRIFLARDPFGVRPMFRVHFNKGVLGVCSEAKGLVDLTKDVADVFDQKWNIEPFPPGVFEEYSVDENGLTTLVRRESFYSIEKPVIKFRSLVPVDSLHPTDVLFNIRTLLTSSVRKRLMSDRRIGCLLSGGLDSSLVAALLCKVAKEEKLPYAIQTFSIGMGDSPDILAARKVAKHIGSEHHEVLFTEQDVSDVLDNVIYSLESYDITTIRASIGMYLVSKYIRQKTDTTVILSGEGADELMQGYIYFRDAPSAEIARDESIRLLKDIYLYDGLRADRTTAAFGLELRVPFLDLEFTRYVMSLDNTLLQPKKGVEKHLLRSAFEGTNLLPNEILWRHKEAFSDGVASIRKSLFEVVQEIVDKRLQGVDIAEASKNYDTNPPKTKESLYYRRIFEKTFPSCSNLTPYMWMPRWVNVTDPSARFISHYAAEKKN